MGRSIYMESPSPCTPSLVFFVFARLHPFGVQNLLVLLSLLSPYFKYRWFSTLYNFHFCTKWNPTGLPAHSHTWAYTHERGQVGTPRKSTQFSTKIALTRRLPSAPSLRLLCAHNVCVVVLERQPVTSVRPLRCACMPTRNTCSPIMRPLVRDKQPRMWERMTLAWRSRVAAQHRTDAQEARPQFLLRIMPAETGEATCRDALSVSPNFAASTSTNRRRRVSAKSKFSTSWQNQQKHPQT